MSGDRLNTLNEVIEINKSAKSLSIIDCHLMPCEIKRSMPAEVDNYFQTRESQDQKNYLNASFHGRPLQGQEIILPKNYSGVIVEQTKPGENKHFTVKNKCGKVIYWNWDKIPSANDSFIKMIDWLSLSQTINMDE